MFRPFWSFCRICSGFRQLKMYQNSLRIVLYLQCFKEIRFYLSFLLGLCIIFGLYICLFFIVARIKLLNSLLIGSCFVLVDCFWNIPIVILQLQLWIYFFVTLRNWFFIFLFVCLFLYFFHAFRCLIIHYLIHFNLFPY